MGGEVVHALDNVSFEIEQGEFISIMGPSGSGKSTLMNLIGALDKPTGGDLIINGQNLSEMDADGYSSFRNTRIGFVFQQFNLLPRTSALENVKLPLLYARDHRYNAADRARECLARVGLQDRLDHQPTQLSGGQQQRVAIARALVNAPDMILADEPVASLDPVLAHSIMKHLEEINKKDGVTVLCSLHFLDLVHRYADRVIALNQGQLVFEGFPRDIDDKKFKDIYGRDAERVG